MYRQLVQNSIFAMGAKFFGIGLAFFLSPYLIRSMGEAGYGVWILAASLSASGGYLSLLDPGFQGATIKYIAQYRATDYSIKLRKTIWISIVFFTSIGVIGCVALIIFGAFFATRVFNVPENLHRSFQILIYLFAIKTVFDFTKLSWTAICAGYERYDILHLVEIGTNILFAGLAVFFLSSGYNITYVGVASLLASALFSFVLMFGLSRLVPSSAIWPIPRQFSWETDIKPIFKLSGGLFGFQATGIVYRQIDKLLIPIMLTSTLLTPYSVANYFFTASQSIRGFIAGNYVPIASSLNAMSDKRLLQDAFLRGTKFTLAFTLPVVIVGIWLARPFITFWLGEEMEAAVIMAQILLAINLFVTTSVVGFNVMIGIGKVKRLVMINLSSLILNIILTIVLIHYFGVIGAVLGTFLSQLFVWFPYNHLYVEELELSWKIFFHKALFKPYFIAGIFVLLIGLIHPFVTPQNLFQTIVLGGCAMVIYFIIFFAIGLDIIERQRTQLWFRAFYTKLAERVG